MKKILFFVIMTLMTSEMMAQEGFSYRKGYRGSVEAGFMGVFNKEEGGFYSGVETSHGYSFGNGSYIGAGFGFLTNAGGTSERIPLFLDAKYSFSNADVSPFVQARGGVCLIDSRAKGNILSVGGGLDFGRLSCTVSYMMESNWERVQPNPVQTVKVMHNRSMLSVTFSVGF